MPRSTSVARRSSAQATELLLPDLLMQLELHSPLLLLEMAKWEAPSGGRDSLARLVPAKLEALQQDPLAKANRSSVKEDLDLHQTEQRLAVVHRPALLFCRRARANIRKILAHAHLRQKYRVLENVIARRAAAVAPLSLDIGGGVIGAHLLAVAINAAVRSVNAPAARDHSRLRHRINIGAFLVGLRIEMSDLPIWNDRQSHPGERERPEDSQKKRS